MKAQAAREAATAQRAAGRVKPKTAMITWMEGHSNRHHTGRVIAAQDRTGEAQAELAGVKAQAATEVAAAQRAAGRAKAAAAELAEDLEAARDEAEREAVLRQACIASQTLGGLMGLARVAWPDLAELAEDFKPARDGTGHEWLSGMHMRFTTSESMRYSRRNSIN